MPGIRERLRLLTEMIKLAPHSTGPDPVVSRISEDRTTRELRCVIETTFAGNDHLSGVWDQVVCAQGSSIYMTYDWLKCWWQYYGAGRRLRLFLFLRGEDPVAALPFYLETFGAGWPRISVARLVGANLPPKAFDPPVDSTWAPQIFARILECLFREEGCDLLSFGPVSQSWPPARAFEEACAKAREWVSRPEYRARDVRTVFQLPSSFDQYLNSLSGTERKNRLKRMRQLEKNHQVTSDIISDPDEVGPEFDAFVRHHARQWEASGKGGHFAAWPDGEAYNRALVKAQARQGRVRFFRLLVDGQVVANRYTFLLGTTLYSELPARAVGEPWDKLGIGAISLLKFNESAIEAGVSMVDSGLGRYEHKAHLGGDQIPVGVWRLSGRGASAVKAWIICMMAGILQFAGHKLWYRRILPRLPHCFKRTQQSWWLRVDV